MLNLVSTFEHESPLATVYCSLQFDAIPDCVGLAGLVTLLVGTMEVPVRGPVEVAGIMSV